MTTHSARVDPSRASKAEDHRSAREPWNALFGMNRLLSITGLVALVGMCHAFIIVFPPIDGDSEPTTAEVYEGEMVTMKSTVENGADQVVFTVSDSDGNVHYSSSSFPDEDGNISITWFPLFDGTYTIDAVSYLEGVEIGDETVAVVNAIRPDASGFITGGGWYQLNGERNNFGFNAQVLKYGNIRGNLQYQDRVNGFNIHSNNVDWVYAPNCQQGYFSGYCTLNGVSGYRFFVAVRDFGEPATDDGFDLWVYDMDGNLMFSHEADLYGGNIKIHCK